jgi:hypothetical protein
MLPKRRRVIRRTLLVGLIVIFCFQYWPAFLRWQANPMDDFISYWSSAHLLVQGQNPYSFDLNREEQKAQGSQRDSPLILWNPPWVLTLLMPLGLLQFPLAHLVWMAFNVLAIFFSSWELWFLGGGSQERKSMIWILACSFFPTVLVLKFGQITPLILMGAVLFLKSTEERRPWTLGLAILLLSIKPHLVYLFWPFFLLWLFQNRSWPLWLNSFWALFAATIIPWLVNPLIFPQYIRQSQSIAGHMQAGFSQPTWGTVFGLLLGRHSVLLDYLPLTFGIIAITWWQWRYKPPLVWKEIFPILLLVSVITTPHVWSADQIVLLVNVFEVAIIMGKNCDTSFRRRIFGEFVVINLLYFFTVLYAGNGRDYMTFWTFPVWGALYFWVRNQCRMRSRFASMGLPNASS